MAVCGEVKRYLLNFEEISAIYIFQRCPQFKQVTQTFLAPMFPATRPIPPVSAAPTTAFPIPKPFLLAERDVEPHFGQQATPFCLFSLMRSRLLCGFDVGQGVFFTVIGLERTFPCLSTKSLASDRLNLLALSLVLPPLFYCRHTHSIFLVRQSIDRNCLHLHQ